MKMNVFISQPMNGKKTEEIEWEREQFVEDLKKRLGEDINILILQRMSHLSFIWVVLLRFLQRQT